MVIYSGLDPSPVVGEMVIGVRKDMVHPCIGERVAASQETTRTT